MEGVVVMVGLSSDDVFCRSNWIVGVNETATMLM